MEKKSTKGLIIAIVILSLLLVGVSGYLVYDKVFRKDEVKELEKNQTEEQDKKEDDESIIDNDTKEEHNNAIVYTFKEISRTDNSITLGKNTYSLSITNRNTPGQYIKVNNKSLDIENYPKISNIYIWYDLLIVVYSDMMDTNSVVYAYDNTLNSLGQISLEHYGWYSEGMMNVETQDKIQFSQDELTLYHKNVGIGGEVYSLNNINIDNISCEQAKTKYPDVPIQEKLVYKYENNALSEPTKTNVKLLKDYICQ